MKKAFLFMLPLLILLAGCSSSGGHSPSPWDATPPQEAEISGIPPETATLQTLPPHTPLYLEGLSADAVILYFEEICLDAEISNSGDPSRLQKWDSPILYQVLGAPTTEDIGTILTLAQWLNTVPGFPGMREASDGETPSMDIRFCSREEMADILGDWTLSCDGGVTFWFDADVVYSATVCIRTDLEQELRNSVILEEIYNSLGPIQDTSLREDSIVWSGYSQPQWLTPEDMLLMTLLYHPDMKPGMDSRQCAEVIRNLYY